MYNYDLLRNKDELKKQLMQGFWRKCSQHQTQSTKHAQLIEQPSEQWVQQKTNHHSVLSNFMKPTKVVNENMQSEANRINQLVAENQFEWEDSHCRQESRTGLQEARRKCANSNTNYSILEEFSKSPYPEGETSVEDTGAVYGFTRTWVPGTFPQDQRTKEAMVQTQSEPESRQLLQRTPAKNLGFKHQQSLVDVSGNLSQVAYLEDKTGSVSREMDPESVAKGSRKGEGNRQSHALFKTFEIDDQQSGVEENNADPKNKKHVKLIRKGVQENKLQNSQGSFQSTFGEINKQAHELFYAPQFRDAEDGTAEDKWEERKSLQRIKSVVRKQSSTKELILRKQGQSQEIDKTAAGKSVKNNCSAEELNLSRRPSDNESQLIRMLPDYDSSSNGLEAVLEDELEDLEDSIQSTSMHQRQATQQSQQLKRQHPIKQVPQPANRSNITSSANSQKVPQALNNQLVSQSTENLIAEFQEIRPLHDHQTQEPHKLSEAGSSLKSPSISYSCLEDLGDVSSIKKLKENSKLFSDEKPHNSTVKLLTEDLHSSQSSQLSQTDSIFQLVNKPQCNTQQQAQAANHQQQKVQNNGSKLAREELQSNSLQMMMVKDIQQQIQSLKQKMESDCEGSTGNQEKAGPEGAHKECLKWETLIEKPKKGESVCQGSEGASQSSRNVLNLFDATNSDVDFTEIFNHVTELRDRILSDSNP